MYGISPGTFEGRRKGGLVSQKRRRENPEYYQKLGCVVRNFFIFPQYCEQLAEFVGIVLGDGGITDRQLYITLNSVADQKYIDYVRDLISRLFNYKPSLVQKKDKRAKNILITRVNFVNFLIDIGLKIGDKVKQQVAVPPWIKSNENYSHYCLRGLIDTDGGLFVHRYSINGKHYQYLKLCFSNKSQPLRNFVYNQLSHLQLRPYYSGEKQVWLYSEKKVKRYLQLIGSSNERLLGKVDDIIEISGGVA